MAAIGLSLRLKDVRCACDKVRVCDNKSVCVCV